MREVKPEDDKNHYEADNPLLRIIEIVSQQVPEAENLSGQRVGFLVAVLMFGTGALLYLILAIVIPDETLS